MISVFNKLVSCVERLSYMGEITRELINSRSLVTSPFFVSARYTRLTLVRACISRVLNNLLALNKAFIKYIEIIMIHHKI